MKHFCQIVWAVLILSCLTTAPLAAQDTPATPPQQKQEAATETDNLSPDKTACDPNAQNTINVKEKVFANYFAGSKIKDPQAIGGFGRSDNMPQTITQQVASSSGKCYLLAQPTVVTERGQQKGMRLVLVNATEQPIFFNASDSRLSLVQEAKNAKGEWKPIERLPVTSCGNSFHRVAIGAGEFWAFPANRYTGTFKTELRFRLKRPEDQGGDLVANTFEGSINPSQFNDPPDPNIREIEIEVAPAPPILIDPPVKPVPVPVKPESK